MNEYTITDLLSGGLPVYTGDLSYSMNVDRRELFMVLNQMAKEGRLERSMMFIENGTSRPTIGFGWKCPQD